VLKLGDKPRQGKRQDQAAKRPDPPFKEYYGNEDPSDQEKRTYKAKTNAPVLHSISVASVAAQNLINIVAVFTTSGAGLLGLLFAKHL
jgi:hypothetical protein